MRPRSSPPRWPIVLVVTLVVAACKEASTGPPIVTDPPVASVTVTSSIDSVIPIGGPNATMTAVARDASNNTVSGLTWMWSSGTQATATINAGTGVVTAVAAGTTLVTAAQDNNAQTGSLRLRAVNADLPGVTATMTDAFVVALRNALGATPQGAVGTLVGTCQTNVTSGNLLAINTCLNSLIAVNGTGTDAVLLSLLDLFFAHAQDQLQL